VPELPEVEALARFLGDRASGREVAGARLLSVAALKTFDPPAEALVGRMVGEVSRRGKFLVVGMEGDPPLSLVVHLARAGWLRWHDEVKPAAPGPTRPRKGPLAFQLVLADGAGIDLTEAGTEKRLALYVVRSPDEVEGIGRLGPDPLDPAVDADVLAARLREHGGQLKGALTDQTVLAGVGNAYSDEVLHVARLSPFKAADKLSDEEAARLHRALREVLEDAVQRSADLPAAGLKAEKRAGMRVHGRKGQPCPECGDVVREVSFATKFLNYCPTCQTGGQPLADRRLSRLLK